MSAARLRNAEWLAALGSVVALVALLAIDWYGAPSRSGWAAIPTLRWFVLATVALGLALALAQATCRGPALPVTLDLLATIIAGLTTILLFARLASTGAPLRFGAVLGMLACVAVTVGAFRALRTEQGWTPQPGREVEIVKLGMDGES